MEAVTMTGQMETIMQQSYQGVLFLHATLAFIGAFLMSGLHYALKKLDTIADRVSSVRGSLDQLAGSKDGSV
jgi:hypothetical protein